MIMFCVVVTELLFLENKNEVKFTKVNQLYRTESNEGLYLTESNEVLVTFLNFLTNVSQTYCISNALTY